MGLVKVYCGQYFLHQDFYKTPKTKHYIYERRKLMYNHQNVAFHLFSSSAATLENIFKIQLFQNYGITYVLMTWINFAICHMQDANLQCIISIKKILPYFEKKTIVFFSFLFFMQPFNFCQLLVQIFYLFQYIIQKRLSSRKQQ